MKRKSWGICWVATGVGALLIGAIFQYVVSKHLGVALSVSAVLCFAVSSFWWERAMRNEQVHIVR